MEIRHQEEKLSEEYIKFLRRYLGPDPDALAWVTLYSIYVHAIDDIIDEEKDPEFILRTFELAAILYNNNWYLSHFNELYPLIKMASNSYMDSVEFEKSDKAWKNHVADIIRQNVNELVLACIEIVSGYNAKREASSILRELSYFAHHRIDGTAC